MFTILISETHQLRSAELMWIHVTEVLA